MRWKQHKPEQIVVKLDRVAAAVKRGAKLSEIVKAEGICEATYFRWRALYGGLKPAQLARYRDLEIENARLRKLLDEIESSDELLRA